MSKKGFTLIEVLVVVAIVGILASLVVVGLGGTQARGRDAKRLSDLQQARNGLELYMAKCGYYPGTPQNNATCAAYAAQNTWALMRNAVTGSAIGVNSFPQADPLSGRPAAQGYQYISDGSTYMLAATLEDASNRALQDDIDGTQTIGGGTIDCADPVYCVQL